MSMGAFKWAKTWDGLSSNEKFVLIMIADHYNEEVHRAWPSMETLAKETGMSRSTVIRCIKSLEGHGLIKPERWVREYTGGKLANRYCLPWYDDKSIPAKHQPVVAHAGFDENGRMEYDTFGHQFRHDEEVPSWKAAS